MHRTNIAVTLFVTLIAGITFAHGQQQTERYIPIGQSPGLSGKHTHIGTIEAADTKTRIVSVAAADRRYSVTVTERTRIWLDQNRLKLTTLKGSFADLAIGSRVEVKSEGSADGPSAEWIKVEMTAPRAAGAPGR